QEQKAILTIAMMAAFADGRKDDAEREAIRHVAETLGREAGGGGLAGLYQDVLLQRVRLVDAAPLLKEPGQRQLAYEMAVCVCDADGLQSPAETAFLAELKTLLNLNGEEAEAEHQADALAEAADQASPAATVAGLAPAATAAPTNAARDAELDRSILNYAKLTGALELLPQSWASIAIVPLQVKMVYGIGKA